MLAQPPIWIIIVGFVCMLAPVVFFHELGHYLVGRVFGVGAETFSIGFGHEIVGWTDKQGTRWKIGWLPLGGYVRFVGDMNAASAPGDAEELPPELREHSFPVKPVWQRFLIVLAGPAANFLLAIIIFAGLFCLVAAPDTNKIGRIEPKSAAAVAGIQRGDRILAVSGHKTPTLDEVRSVIEPRPNQFVRIELERGGAVRQVQVKVGILEGKDETGKKVAIGVLGVSGAPVSIFKAIPLATEQTALITASGVEGVARLIIGQGSRQDVGGPIKIAQVAGEAASLGALPFIQLVALLSINLGFINLLPVPLMDGGHLFFYGMEAIRRRPLSARAFEWAFRGGLAIILALMAFTTINDLSSIGLWDRLGRLIG